MIQQAVAHLRVEGPQTAGLLPRHVQAGHLTVFGSDSLRQLLEQRTHVDRQRRRRSVPRRSAAEPTPRPASASKRGPWQPPAVRSIGTPCAMATTAWRDLLGAAIAVCSRGRALSSKLSCRAPPCEILGRAGDCSVVPRLGYEARDHAGSHPSLHGISHAPDLSIASPLDVPAPNPILTRQSSAALPCRSPLARRSRKGLASWAGRTCPWRCGVWCWRWPVWPGWFRAWARALWGTRPGEPLTAVRHAGCHECVAYREHVILGGRR